jgi:RecB family exonuclease
MDQGTAPSALLLNYELPPVISTAPPTLLTARGLIAQLRATAIDSTVSENLRHAAINRLGYLAKQSDIRFKPAQPSQWWFIADLTQSDQPLLSTPTDLRVSGSMLESITRCPTQWFFERKLGIKDQLVANTVIGIAIHAVAQKIVAEKLTADQAMAELTKLWPTEVFDAPWQAKVQLAEALNMVKALHVWVSENANETLGAEVSFEVLHAGLEVTLVGKIDLLQKNEKDELEVIDFKTGAAKPSKADLMEHSQLGVYQLAVGISQEMNQAQLPVSAKLIQIRARNAKDQVVEQMAPDLGDAKWLVDEIETAKSRIITEDLPARPGPHCRNCKVRNICPAVPEGDQVNA